MDDEPLPTREFKPITRRLSRRLSPGMVSDIVRRYRSGESTTKLGEEFGVSRSSLATLLRQQGVVFRGAPISEEVVSQEVKLCQDR